MRKRLAETIRERATTLPPVDDWPEAERGEAWEGNGHGNGVPAAIPRVQAVGDLLKRHLTLLESIGHDDLMDADLPPLRWLVDGLLPDEGLTFLGGKKKLGKSYLCLQIAQAIAQGIPCLGRETVKGEVAYICLEDGRRRLKGRLQQQQAARGLGITYYTRFPPLDGDGMGHLLELLSERRPKLLIIDTLAAAKTGKLDENAAGPMADLGNTLRFLAQHFSLGVLCTHHHGKGTTGDPGNDLRGSSALGGAGDVNLGLYREEGVYLLRGEGRDIEEFSLRLQFDFQSTWAWQALGDSRQLARDQADQELLDALRALGEADTQALADYLGKSRQKILDRCHKLVNAGLIVPRIEAAVGTAGGRPRTYFRLSLSERDL